MEIGDHTIGGMTLKEGKTTGDDGAIRSLTMGSLTIQDSVLSGNHTMGE